MASLLPVMCTIDRSQAVHRKVYMSSMQWLSQLTQGL